MSKRNFHNFELGDNVYELADGMIPELAERAGLNPEQTPSTDMMGQLVGIIGKNKVLRDNDEVSFLSLGEMAGYVERAGTQEPLSRSLWTPDVNVPEGTPRLLTGAVANWQDRAANLLVSKAEQGGPRTMVYMALGNRVMESATEQANPNIQAFHEKHGAYPAESEYGEAVIAPRLAEAGYDVDIDAYETSKGDEIADLFVFENLHLFEKGQVSFVRVANAGIQLAVQFRKAAQNHVGSSYDDYRNPKALPQAFVETDGFPVAKLEEQTKLPTQFQAPQTGLRQVALTAKLLHETTE